MFCFNMGVLTFSGCGTSRPSSGPRAVKKRRWSKHQERRRKATSGSCPQWCCGCSVNAIRRFATSSFHVFTRAFIVFHVSLSYRYLLESVTWVCKLYILIKLYWCSAVGPAEDDEDLDDVLNEDQELDDEASGSDSDWNSFCIPLILL